MQFASAAKVNTLFYISTLKDEENYIIQDTLRSLVPFFEKINLPFVYRSISRKHELVNLLQDIKIASEGGLLPLIHIIGHGAKDAGLGISDANEMMYWDDLSSMLREINIACGNNLCVVASSCYALEVIEEIKLQKPVPFYMLIAPEHKLQFSYFITSTVSLYESILTGMDIIKAYNEFCSEQMKMFHCEKMLARVFAKYVIENCRGEGRVKRIDHLVELALKGGRFTDTPENRMKLGALADASIGPTQAHLDRFSSIFLIGKSAGFDLSDIILLIDKNQIDDAVENGI